MLCVTYKNSASFNDYRKAGADELIFPLERMCFTAEEEYSFSKISSWLPECHGSGLRASVMMNRLFAEEDAGKAEDLLINVLNAGADAVFFADPALMVPAERLGLMGKMIYRPETLMTSSRDAGWWMSQGLQSVQISPLLTSEEIMHIASCVPHCGLQIHGRLLMSVSARKLLTSYTHVISSKPLHGRNNLWIQEEKREGRMPVYENDYGTMIYTDYVQESFSFIKDFSQAGVERFEIDGYTLSQNAVFDAVKAYRSLLDGREADADAYLKRYPYPFEQGYYGEKTIK